MSRFHSVILEIDPLVRFVATAEDIASPYEFGVYDVLFLPASFPYGGTSPLLNDYISNLSN